MKKDPTTLNSKPSTLNSLKKYHTSVVGMFLVMILFFIYPTNFALTAVKQRYMQPDWIKHGVQDKR